MSKRMLHNGQILAALAILIILAMSASGQLRLRVLATHLPLWSMAEHLASDRAEVSMLVSPGTDLHTFSLRPGDVKALLISDLMLMNGAGLEAALGKGVEKAKSRVDTSAGLDLIVSGHEINPHVWLSPFLAAHQARAMRDALVKADPDGRDVYRLRAEELTKKLGEMDSLARIRLAPIKGAPLITYHGAFDYLAGSYGLEPYSLTGPHGEAPLPGRLRNVYDLVRKSGVGAVFSVEGFPAATLLRLSRDLGVRICTLDPLTSGYEDVEGYLGGMMKNVDTIARCLLARPRADGGEGGVDE